jgi:hypothetical protein
MGRKRVGRADWIHISFARQDAVQAAWRVVDPILGDVVPVHQYPRSRSISTRAGAGVQEKPTGSCPPVTPGATRRVITDPSTSQNDVLGAVC